MRLLRFSLYGVEINLQYFHRRVIRSLALPLSLAPLSPQCARHMGSVAYRPALHLSHQNESSNRIQMHFDRQLQQQPDWSI